MCPGQTFPMRSGSGLTGFFPQLTPTAPFFTAAGTCPGAGFATTYSNPQNLYRVDLSAFPMGGNLLLSTCNAPQFGASATGWTGDNVLHVFLGCPNPASAAASRCVAGNDQACSSLAAVNITSTNQTQYFVVVGGYSTIAWSSGFWWNYVLPTPTNTP